MGLRLAAFFASPDHEIRLRIDKEHRAIAQVLRDTSNSPISFTSHQAATFGDVLAALTRESYELVQFSAHGTPDHLIFDIDSDSPVGEVDLGKVAQVLQQTQPNLRMALFMSCFSADALIDLRAAAPYVVTIEDTGPDELCIRFVTAFYAQLAATGSVDRAFESAKQLVSYWQADLENPVLSIRLGRRSELMDSGHTVEVRMLNETAIVDLTPCLQDVERLEIDYGQFVEAICRKMRLHEWIFRAPLGGATIGIGAYIGEFQWENPDDVVTCSRVLSMRSEVSPDACQALMDLLVAYNDLSVAPYRRLLAPASVENATHLQAALTTFQQLIAEPTDVRASSSPMSGWLSSRLREHLPQNLWTVPIASMRSSIAMASTKLAGGYRPETVSYLENALSSMHDIVRAAIANLCE